MAPMDHIVTLAVPDFGLVSALYSGAEPPQRGTVCVVERQKDSTLGTALSSLPLSKHGAKPECRLLRPATDDDRREDAACRTLEREALDAFAALAAKYDLPTRPVHAYAFLGRHRLLLWHTPQGPLPDLRSFEGELRRKVRCPVELRATDARGTAALLGGCGCCGRGLCCVAGRIPREEDIPPHPATSSSNGLCNCPKCCLGF